MHDVHVHPRHGRGEACGQQDALNDTFSDFNSHSSVVSKMLETARLSRSTNSFDQLRFARNVMCSARDELHMQIEDTVRNRATDVFSSPKGSRCLKGNQEHLWTEASLSAAIESGFVEMVTFCCNEQVGMHAHTPAHTHISTHKNTHACMHARTHACRFRPVKCSIVWWTRPMSSSWSKATQGNALAPGGELSIQHQLSTSTKQLRCAKSRCCPGAVARPLSFFLCHAHAHTSRTITIRVSSAALFYLKTHLSKQETFLCAN